MMKYVAPRLFRLHFMFSTLCLPLFVVSKDGSYLQIICTVCLFTRHGHRQYNERGGYYRPRGGGRGGGRGGEDYPPPRSERRYQNRAPRDDLRSPANEERAQHSDNDDGEDASHRKPKERRPRSYFILKCNNEKNMTISFQRSIWATTKSNEKRLHRAFNDSDEVLLIFSVQGSGRFQGVAKMTSGITDKFCEDFGSANLGGVFDVEWVYQEDLPFQATQHLVNPWNDNKKVQISRDAQEVEPSVGQSLVDLWEKAPELQQQQQQQQPREERMRVSPDDSTGRLNPADEGNPGGAVGEFYSTEIYSEGEPQQYVEEYPMYSPPPFNTQFIPEFQQVPAHYPPPPHHMYHQQPYPMYAPTGNMSPYRHQQEYYSLQYPPPRRGAPGEIYQRSGGAEHYQNGRPSHDKGRGGGYRS